MSRTSRYSQEVRERAVRMVFEHGSEYDSDWEAICSGRSSACTVGLLRKSGWS